MLNVLDGVHSAVDKSVEAEADVSLSLENEGSTQCDALGDLYGES